MNCYIINYRLMFVHLVFSSPRLFPRVHYCGGLILRIDIPCPRDMLVCNICNAQDKRVILETIGADILTLNTIHRLCDDQHPNVKRNGKLHAAILMSRSTVECAPMMLA